MTIKEEAGRGSFNYDVEERMRNEAYSSCMKALYLFILFLPVFIPYKIAEWVIK